MRAGRQCPVCQDIDTAEVLPGLWTCWTCGDEFEPAAKTKRSAKPVLAPPSSSGLAPSYHGRPQPC